MLESRAEQAYKISSVLLWQASVVLMLSLLFAFFSLSWFSALFGGFVVAVSTWHVHRSVCCSGGDKGYLLKAAGLRFGLFLLVTATAFFFLSLQPVELIAGRASAYVAMYVGSLMMIFKKMKGDNLG